MRELAIHLYSLKRIVLIWWFWGPFSCHWKSNTRIGFTHKLIFSDKWVFISHDCLTAQFILWMWIDFGSKKCLFWWHSMSQHQIITVFTRAMMCLTVPLEFCARSLALENVAFIIAGSRTSFSCAVIKFSKFHCWGTTERIVTLLYTLCTYR